MAHANMAEVLFFALMLCTTHRGRVEELNSWVNKVLQDEFNATELKEQWKPEGWDKSTKYQVSAAFEPLEHAHKHLAWTEGALDDISLAMQAWRGEGQVDGLSGALLKNYINRPPLSAVVTKKRDPPPRYRSWVIVRVARLGL